MEIKNYFAQDAQGNIMPSANCYLYLPGTTTLATGLVDGNGTPISNPFLASSNGQVTFGAPNGVYDLRVSLGPRDWKIKIQCADIVQAMVVMDSILGSHAENPTTRNNGQSLQPGDETWNSTNKMPYWWDGSAWIALNSSAQDLKILLASSAGGKQVGTISALADAVTRTVTDKLNEHVSLLDVVPPGTDLWNTNLTPYFQPLVTGWGVVEAPKGNLRVNGKVYVRSDREIPGMGCTFGGTVYRNSVPGSFFAGGNAGSVTHTRIRVSRSKFVSDNIYTGLPDDAPERKLFSLSFIDGFMNEFSNLSFGDISGQGNQQNGLELTGTAHFVSNIRGLGMATVPGQESTTGILLKSTRGTNTYLNIQSETNAQVIMDGERNSRFIGSHSERSNWDWKNCSWNLHAGGYIIDGTNRKDERCAGNTTLNLGGANSRASDLGMFNKYTNCATSLGSHGALEYGIGDSYLKETVIATAWNSAAPHKAYKLPAAGWYIAIVLCKNTYQNGTLTGVQAGNVEVYNATTSTVLATKAYSITNNSGIVGSQAQSGNATQTVILCFQGAVNDNIVVRDRTGVVKVFISPIENVNPMMLNGSAWSVSGAPVLSGESYFSSSVNVTPVFSGGQFQMPLDGLSVFGLTQFFKPRTAAELYCVVVKGTWTAGSLRVSPYSGNDGARNNSVSQNLDTLAEDGKRYLVQYIDGRALSSSESVTRIAIGSTLAPPAQTMVIDMVAVFPVR